MTAAARLRGISERCGEVAKILCIPCVVLKGYFYSDPKSYFLDKRVASKGVLSATPDAIFFEKHLYSKIDELGRRDVSVEKELADLEGRSSLVIDKLVKSGRSGVVPRLGPDERVIWDEFFYFQWKRTPDIFHRLKARADFKGSVDWAVKEFERNHRPLTEKEREDTQDPAVLKRLEQNARVKAVSAPSAEVMSVLATKGLAILAIVDSNKGFVIGSDPIAKLGTPGQSHLAAETVEAWLPIATDIAVSFASWPAGEERLVEDGAGSQIDRVNQAIFDQSTLIASSSPELTKAVAKHS